MRFIQRPMTRLLLGLSWILLPSLAARQAAAQSTVGVLTATIVDERGRPMPSVTVTLERSGTALRTVQSTHNGVATFGVLAPGNYDLLAEELAYQPVRMHDIVVVSGGSSRVSVALHRMPPPITSVANVASNAVVGAPSAQAGVSGQELWLFPRTHDITSIARGYSEATVPDDGRQGFTIGVNGLRSEYSALQVDGVREALLRHPGLPGEPATAPAFGRDGLNDASFTTFGPISASQPVMGGMLNGGTAPGSGRFSFRPWATVSSSKLGGRSADNPGDSSATSIQAGVAMGGALKGDTAAWAIRADYQQLELPSASPFATGISSADTNSSIAGAVTAAAQAAGHRDVSSFFAPTVRTWKGGSGMGRIDWRFGPATLFAIRAGGASWTETNPQVGNELVSGAGTQLKAHDISVAAALTTGSEVWTSETRVGGHNASRDWTTAATPYTAIVGDGIAFGSAANLAGTFKETSINLNEVVTLHLGDHTVKGGANIEHRNVNYDYFAGENGAYTFGDLATFSAGRGAYYQAFRSGPAADIGVNLVGLFAEDVWQATSALQIFAGVRFDHEVLPTDLIAANASWERLTGLPNNAVPLDAKGSEIGPRGGFHWDASGNGHTLVSGAVAMVPGEFDLATFNEAAQFDGAVSVRRATGTLTWPANGATNAGLVGPSLTTFGPQVRKPRAFKTDFALAQSVGTGTTLTLAGAYRHADYLLQRTDLNLVSGSLATDADGRALYGSLEQYGGLLTPTVGSNRRFPEFDKVYGLTSTGYNDYYGATVSLDHHLSRTMSLMLSYTYSKTTDNLPGELSADPADHLSPFPEGLNGERWEDGRSDLDIPNRVAATLSLATPGNSGLRVAVRYRGQSGRPFTPGFRQGVDANGDGSGNNDPAFVSTTMNGLAAIVGANSCLASQSGKIAERNSCRDAMVNTLDASASVMITHGLALTVDGYNLVGTATGLYDHALVLVDPKGSVTTNSAGKTVLPLIANPGFGQLLSRRGDARVIRIGFRVEK